MTRGLCSSAGEKAVQDGGWLREEEYLRVAVSALKVLLG